MTQYKKLYDAPSFACLRDLVYFSASKFGNRTAFLVKDNGKERKITYKDFYGQYISLCSDFIRRGLEGKRIAVCGHNSYGWVLSYLAACTVGVVVPIDRELFGENISDFCKSADCRAICLDERTKERLQGFDSPALHLSLCDIEHTEIRFTETDKAKIDSITYQKDEMRILIFTSGTTGNSKGVCLSQHNICSNIHSTSQMVRIKSQDRTLSILPLHHTYECTLNCMLILSRGACITYCDGLTKVAQNAAEYSPSVLVVVPALLRVMSKRISKSVSSSCPAKYRTLFEENSLAYAMSRVPFLIRLIIKKKIRKSLGDNIRLFIVGAAELDTSLVDDFAAVGIRTLQGYGLTECSPLLAGNNDFFYNPRSTGRAIPGVELKIYKPNELGVGEIIARGENIMLGYFEDKAATDKVLYDGYFHTGDLGQLDENGFLFIRGRIKNVIVTENGKNIYPEELEKLLSEEASVLEILVLAAKDSKGSVCVKAKILPNIEFLRSKLGHLPSIEEMQAMMKAKIDEINRKLPDYKRIRLFEILEKGLERTTTQKIKRFGDNLA